MFDALPPIFYEVCGFVGVAIYLGSYAALQTGFLRGHGYAYAAYNLLASSLVLNSLLASFNLWSAIIQVSFMLISIIGITRTYVLRRGINLTEEETALVRDKFSHMPPQDARLLVRKGSWTDGEKGDVLARQGEVIGQLHYISDGSADIRVNGRSVATSGPGGFIGEMSVLNGAPASADVVLNEPTRYFSITADALERVCKENTELRLLVENALSADTRGKLRAANERLGALA